MSSLCGNKRKAESESDCNPNKKRKAENVSYNLKTTNSSDASSPEEKQACLSRAISSAVSLFSPNTGLPIQKKSIQKYSSHNVTDNVSDTKSEEEKKAEPKTRIRSTLSIEPQSRNHVTPMPCRTHLSQTNDGSTDLKTDLFQGTRLPRLPSTNENNKINKKKSSLALSPKSQAKLLSSYLKDTYKCEISDYDSDDDGETDHILNENAPEWVKKKYLKEQLWKQTLVDPEKIFGRLIAEDTWIDLPTLFEKSTPARIEGRGNSSFQKGKDALSYSEEKRYKKKMGFVTSPVNLEIKKNQNMVSQNKKILKILK